MSLESDLEQLYKQLAFAQAHGDNTKVIEGKIAVLRALIAQRDAEKQQKADAAQQAAEEAGGPGAPAGSSEAVWVLIVLGLVAVGIARWLDSRPLGGA